VRRKEKRGETSKVLAHTSETKKRPGGASRLNFLRKVIGGKKQRGGRSVIVESWNKQGTGGRLGVESSSGKGGRLPTEVQGEWCFETPPHKKEVAHVLGLTERRKDGGNHLLKVREEGQVPWGGCPIARWVLQTATLGRH